MSDDGVLAIVQTGPERFEEQRLPRPRIGADDALLRVEACGICGSDVEQFRGRFDSLGVVRYPLIPGHEPLGVIEEIGDAAAARWNVRRGDRVAVEPLIPCWHCEACLAGRRSFCTGWGRMMSYGFVPTSVEPGLWGAYAKLMYLHPNSVVHKIDPDLPPEIAVMFNPLGAGIRWAYQEPGTRLGDTVAILGAGQRGLACVIAARAAGAGTIIISDLERARHKLELAREFGADHVIAADTQDVVEAVTEITEGRLADVVIEVTAMATQPVIDAIEIVRPGGTIVVAGVKGGAKIPGFVSDRLVFKSITMRGVLSVETPAYVEAIRLIESGRYPLERMQSATFALRDAEQAVRTLGGDDPSRDVVHVAIKP